MKPAQVLASPVETKYRHYKTCPC